MIYDLTGTPLNIALGNIGLRLAERKLQEARRPKFSLLVGHDGKPAYYVKKDKLGRPYPVYRASPIPLRHRPKYDGAALAAIRAEKGCGRPPHLRVPIPTQQFPMQWALSLHGSQRAAARALGIALSTFQRRLAKEQACA